MADDEQFRTDGLGDQDPWPDAEDRQQTRRIVLTPASKIRPRAVRWLWDTTPEGQPLTSHGRIPAYMATIASGGAGIGKSQFAVWLTARVTTGTLPGELYGTPRSVFYAATEDSWEHTIVPRLIAAGANLDLVFRIDVVDDGELHARLTLPSDISLLGKQASEYSLGLLIADPLLSLIDQSINDYRAAEVRAALEPLVACAEKNKFTIVGLAHNTKNGAADPLLRIAGSGAFGQVVRAAIAFIRNDGDDGRPQFVMSQAKNNLGRLDLPSYAYSIQSVDVETEDDGTAHTSRFVLGEETDTSVADVMRAENAPDDHREAITEATAWLREHLAEAGGHERVPEIKRAARKEGISDSTLYRARTKLGIRARQAGFGKERGATWYLPEAWEDEDGGEGDAA